MRTTPRLSHLKGGNYRRLVASLVAAIGCMGVVAACGQAQATTAKRHHHPAAASETPADLISSIESGFGQVKIVNATLGDPPAEYKNQVTGPWMYVQLNSLAGADSILGRWEANLLAAAYAAQAPSVGLTPVGGMFVISSPICLTDRGSDACDETGGPVTDITEGSKKPIPFDPTSDSATSVEGTIRTGLQNVGLNPTSISMYAVDDHPVPVVVAQSDNPSDLLAKPPTDLAIFGSDPNDFEGMYFELDDSQGSPVLVQSFASRTGAGVGWIAPGYQGTGG